MESITNNLRTDNVSGFTIEYWATEIVDIYRNPSFDPKNYVGRKALFETFEGRILEGTLELPTKRPHGALLVIRFEDGQWANVGSYLYLADWVN
jgi:hypothetical protein